MFNNGFAGIKKKKTTIKINHKNIIMKYRVYSIEVKSDNIQENFEQFLNKLDGEVI